MNFKVEKGTELKVDEERGMDSCTVMCCENYVDDDSGIHIHGVRLLSVRTVAANVRPTKDHTPIGLPRARIV